MAAPLLLLLLLAMFTGSDAMFCVCKTGLPDTQLQAAIDYACSKGADCTSAKQGGPCYGNGNKVAVCSYVCNSYYQGRSSMGATCDFNGVAALTGTDPSSGTCKFASGPSSVGTGTTGGAGMGTGGAGAGTGGGMGAGAGTGGGMGAGAGTGTGGTGTGMGTGTSTGTGTGAGMTTPGNTLSPPFGGTGAYGPSGAGSTDYNDATAPRVAGLHVVAALALAAAAAPLLR